MSASFNQLAATSGIVVSESLIAAQVVEEMLRPTWPHWVVPDIDDTAIEYPPYTSAVDFYAIDRELGNRVGIRLVEILAARGIHARTEDDVETDLAIAGDCRG